jgi:hypothetical protein
LTFRPGSQPSKVVRRRVSALTVTLTATSATSATVTRTPATPSDPPAWTRPALLGARTTIRPSAADVISPISSIHPVNTRPPLTHVHASWDFRDRT